MQIVVQIIGAGFTLAFALFTGLGLWTGVAFPARWVRARRDIRVVRAQGASTEFVKNADGRYIEHDASAFNLFTGLLAWPFAASAAAVGIGCWLTLVLGQGLWSA